MKNSVKVQREIKRVWTVKPQQESPIHKVGLVLEPGNWAEFDPFLMMAEDWFQAGVFDFHPHRGIETVTYVIEGSLEHYDNNFGSGRIETGDAQWMTAGRGVIHKETPPVGQEVHTLQLWVNLKSAEKMAEPRYQDLRLSELPVRQEEGATIRIFSGTSGDVTSATKNHVPVTMLEVTLEPGAKVTQELPGSYNGFIYVLEGQGTFGQNKIEAAKNQVLLLGAAEDAENSEISVEAGEKLRFLLFAGEPVRERVVAYGPFVMNSEEQIMQAFADYRAGKFASKNA
ncbi:MAG TPA: pirin family protein [Chloroflexia bacterium]|nr:pirin family protein [Chloroflexia bacterium]